LKIAATIGVGSAFAGGAADLLPAIAKAAAAPARPHAGKTVRIMFIGNPFWDVVKKMASAFEEKTGIKVAVETYGFSVLLQRLDLELSTGSGVYDIAQMVQILIGRTVKAGWATDLMPYIKRDKFTLADFVPGSIKPFSQGDGLFALPWLPDAMAVVYRKDLFDRAGVNAFPATFNELMAIAPRLHTRETAFFLCENNWHWIWPLFLQSYGGNFFLKPPDDLTPTFNTPEAVQSAEFLVELITKYGLPNAVNLDIPGSQAAFQQGRAAMYLAGLGILGAAVDRTKSQVADRVTFASVPRGSAGLFPQLAMHGYMIPTASKQKDAAWEVIKWLTSNELETAMVKEIGKVAQSRYSILRDPTLKQYFLWGGADVAKILQESMYRAGAGYMAYRLVPPYAPIGARIIVAFGQMLSGQRGVKDALDALQRDAVEILRQAGYPLPR
ncbi:MAG TPA: sugar ABC transporter substrate-binding protein, partial [Anaerolineales bacterium]